MNAAYSMPVQSLWFPKQYWGKKEALRWALSHGFRADYGVDTRPTGVIKIRQRPPPHTRAVYDSKTVWGTNGPLKVVYYGEPPAYLSGTAAASVARSQEELRGAYPVAPRYLSEIPALLASGTLSAEEEEALKNLLGVTTATALRGPSYPPPPVYPRLAYPPPPRPTPPRPPPRAYPGTPFTPMSPFSPSASAPFGATPISPFSTAGFTRHP